MTHPLDLIESVRNFMKSRIILSAVELDVFTGIHQGVDTAAALASEKQADVRGMARLLDAAAAYGLLRKKDEKYQLTPESLLLTTDHPDSILPMLLHMNHLWDNWSRLTAAVVAGKNPRPVPVTQRSEQDRNAFIGAMHVIGREMSIEISAALDLSPYRKLLDIGGASGTYTIAFLRKNPLMGAVIFDLPEVVTLAERRLQSAGIRERVELVGGDFYSDPLPKGCDLALLSAIIHQNNREQNIALYRKIHQALVPGGTLMIRDHVMDQSRVDPPAGAVFALNMLVGTEGGDTYTFPEIRETLTTAGFTDIQWIREGKRMDSIVTARSIDTL